MKNLVIIFAGIATFAFATIAFLPEPITEDTQMVASAMPSCDYQAFDFHWPGSPALVTVNPTAHLNSLAPEWLPPIRSGAFSWNNINTKFEYRDGISVINTFFNSNDGYNVVDIANTFGFNNAIAVTQIVDYDGFDGALIDVDIAYGFDWYINNEFDVSCNPNTIDVRSVAIHEFGHMLGLNDCTFCPPESVMKLKTNYGTCYMNISQSDKDCVNTIYPDGTPNPPPPSGCKRGSLPTIALVPNRMQQDFVRLLAYHPDLEEPAAQLVLDQNLAELREIIETQRPATKAVNTFITTHLDFIESQSGPSPQKINETIVEDARVLLETVAQFASPFLKQQLLQVASNLETGLSKTFSQMISDLISGTVAVQEPTPTSFELLGNYPNPFNPSTLIQYQLPEASHVTIKVFDTTGRLVRTLIDQEQDAGSHEVIFTADGLPSGTYLYRVILPKGARTGRMTLIK